MMQALHTQQQSPRHESNGLRSLKRHTNGQWRKGQCGNPLGKRLFVSGDNWLGPDYVNLRVREAFKVLKSRKARPAHKIAALKLLQELLPVPVADRATAASILARAHATVEPVAGNPSDTAREPGDDTAK